MNWRWLFGGVGVRVLLGCNVVAFAGILYLLTVEPRREIPINEVSSEKELPFQQIVREQVDIKPFTEKPLFHASRARREVQRQEVRQAPEAVALPPSKVYRLSGIIGGAKGTIAYVLKPSSGETIQLKVGDIVEDWTVSEVTRDQVTLVQGDATDRLMLER